MRKEREMDLELERKNKEYIEKVNRQYEEELKKNQLKSNPPPPPPEPVQKKKRIIEMHNIEPAKDMVKEEEPPARQIPKENVVTQKQNHAERERMPSEPDNYHVIE